MENVDQIQLWLVFGALLAAGIAAALWLNEKPVVSPPSPKEEKGRRRDYEERWKAFMAQQATGTGLSMEDFLLKQPAGVEVVEHFGVEPADVEKYNV